MEKTNNYKEALEWLRYVLNPDMTMPTVSDWSALTVFAEKQALIGICLPEECPENLSKDLLLQWIGLVQLIEHQNKLLNKRVEQLFGKLEQEGFRCCLLKGQGNAYMYPNSARRCPGDIDVWVDADEKSVYQYVKRMFPDAEESYKHIHFPIFDDVKVDVHVTPLKFYNFGFTKRLQRWINRNKKEQFEHRIRLTGIESEVSVPTAKFNAVYQMGHMLIHLFDEGVGLRQVVDYYYVLKNLKVLMDERKELVSTIKNLGMYKFARAMMWIESSVLGLPLEQCLVDPDERRGKQLLSDILEGGNFGHFSERYNGRSGFYYRGIVEAWRVVKFLPMAPREVVARLVGKMGTALRHAI
jgi:hypothetical protein